MSNTERQRRFRKRNPGYYKRLHRQRQATENGPHATPETASPSPVAPTVDGQMLLFESGAVRQWVPRLIA